MGFDTIAVASPCNSPALPAPLAKSAKDSAVLDLDCGNCNEVLERYCGGV